MIQGESYSIGVLFPDFDINRIIRFKIAIGKTVVGTYPDGNATQITDGFRVALTGDETKLLQGGNSNIQIYITDSQLGVLKPFVTTLKVENTNIPDAGSDVNSGYNFILTVKIKETTVSYSYQFKDLIKGEQGIQGIQGVKGDKGDAGTIDVGTVTTGDAGTDVVVENVGTPSEAVLNFTIPRGSAGDFFSGDYNLIINKQDTKWVDGWLWIDTSSKTALKIINVGYMAISTGIGAEQLKPIVHYPAALTYQTSSIPNGFYIKDEDGRLSENTDFEFLDIRYNILSDTTSKYDGLTKLIGGNAAFDDFDVSHSAAMRTIFLQIYEGFAGEVYRSATDELCGDLRIDAHFEPTYARIRNVDVIGIPIVNAGVIEQTGSNPDILKVASHYSNTFERRDITPNATIFINNVIAIGSCPDEELPTTGTSYGFGVEFFEDTIKTSSEYPNFNYAAWSPIYQQSATTAIISAKFRMIKDAVPAASWDTIRKAARLTARKTVGGVYAAGFPWDMYRGFGVIDVDAAIQYIKDNYTENADYLTALSDDVERTRGIDPMLPFASMSDNTPVPKGKMHEVTENNYTDEDKAKLTELSPIYWDEDNNTFSFPVPDGGTIQIGQEPHDYYTNLQGTQIINGDIVSVVGATGNRTAIALTDAANDAKALACFGMVTVATIGNNNVGRITKSGGKVRGVNTSGYAEGATIYVDPINPGKWTGVKPSAPLRAIQIGVVSVSHAVNGVVELFIKVYPKFTELADVDGVTIEILDAETVPVKKIDGLIKFLSWSNIKATLKTHFDTLYEKLSNKQNSLTVDGTGVKYPTVDAVNAALILKADSIDLIEAKQSISTLENVLSDANINQEAQVTTSGVDTVSLPKTAANTGMQVQMFGQSAQNLVVNGDFRNGTTGWAVSRASGFTVVNGIVEFTPTDIYGLVRQTINNPNGILDKWYLIALVKTDKSTVALSLHGSIVQYHSGSGNYEVLSGLKTTTALTPQIQVQEFGTSNFTKIYADNVMAINLTATFGAGNEPTKEQCDLLFANYFEGSDSVLGTGRVRSVNSSGLNPSYLYFNGGQLRSNGLIKDEIRKGTNGYELVQRINPADGTVRTIPIITPIAHAGLLNSNSNGTAYFEPIIADAGVYSSNLAIQLTDYPIASFESIRKYANGTYTELNPATAVIAGNGLSFTHPNLANGDLVMFTYAYNRESIGRSMTLTHYDNRYVKVDTANGKTYRIDFVVTNGVVVPTATEV